MIEEVAEVAIEALADIGSTSDPRKRRRGCMRWLITFLVASVLLAMIVIALSG
jgi:hypothetical protein